MLPIRIAGLGRYPFIEVELSRTFWDRRKGIYKLHGLLPALPLPSRHRSQCLHPRTGELRREEGENTNLY